MRYKKIMILAILLVSLLAVSAVSAADNATSDILSVNETTDKVVSVENENPEILNENEPGTFTDLANEIAKAKGELNLNKNYKYTSSDSDYQNGITIEESIVINGNGYTINGNNHARIFYVDGFNVNVVNTNFVNAKTSDAGGAIYWLGDSGCLNGCSFVNCSSNDGGAVFWRGSYGDLSYCSFVNAKTTDFGGAVCYVGDYGTLSYCSFVNCSASSTSSSGHSGNNYGGAVYWDGEKGTLSYCRFVNCFASSYNGWGDGGAIYWANVDGTLMNCNFTNNHAEDDGGAISCRYSDRTDIKGCSFVDCYAGEAGGAVWGPSSQCVLSNCSFLNCHARYGGAVEVVGDFYDLENCNFVNSTADEYGGAVYWRGTNGFLWDCSFMDSAASLGGAVYWWESDGDMLECNFMNSAASLGGAVYWWGDYGTLSRCSFVNSMASEGGGIYFSGYRCKLINPTFKNNVAINGSDWYSEYSLDITTDKILTFTSASDVITTYGGSKNLIASLKDIDNNILVGEKISIVLNNNEYTLTTNSKGQVSLSIPTNLAPNTYVATITYAGNDKYASSSTTANVVVQKVDTIISAVYNANNNEVVATLTNDNTGKAISSANVKFNLNGATSAVKTNSKGQAKFSTVGLSSGTASISYAGNSKYKSTSTSIAITTKSDIIISAVYDADNNELVATLTNGDTGKAVTSTTVQVNINGATTTVKTDTKGQAKVSTAGLPLGTNTATISYAGNSKYNSASTSISFNVKTKVIVTDVYAYSDRIVAKLTNGATGKAIANANMIVEINGVKYNAKSDNKGQLTFDTTGLDLPSSYDLTISYRGNDRYTASSATVAVDLNKANMMITTNYHADKQKMVATLKNSKTGKVVSNANMIIELNGVKTTYKSNDQGKITLPTADFAHGIYVGTVTYPGNARYNSISAVFKMDI